ncbi:MAG: tyrosine-type recombinase/integrase [Gammaproteobacteria bacterium]|nr:tyrosine-type recombinase/integrase [Gammaproteobacteria bacterium]
MSTKASKMPGLRLRDGIWHIDKRIKTLPGGRLRESTGTSDLREAERYLTKRLEEIRQASVYGVRPKRTFEQAAIFYLDYNRDKKSILNDAMHLEQVMPFIGNLSLDQVHTGTLQSFIKARQANGIKSKSINNALGVVRHLLNQAASEWLDEHGLTWLQIAPKIKLLKIRDAAEAYPLDFVEQRRLLMALPAHLERMALYKVNTGVREQDVCGLKWDWEVKVPELDTFVFIVPGDVVKNEESRLIVHNSVAQSVIEESRLNRPSDHTDHCAGHRGNECDCARTFVFTYKGIRIGKMNNTGWKRAWRAAGLPVCPQYKRGVHNLKHTFGRRLRAAGVPYETRQVLLGHKNGDITTHYSAAELEELIEGAERVCGQSVHKTPTLTLLKRKMG